MGNPTPTSTLNRTSPLPRVLPYAAATLAIFAICVIFSSNSLSSPFTRFTLCPPAVDTSSADLSGWQNTNVSAASQGKLWKPVQFRTFPHPQLFNVPIPSTYSPKPPAKTVFDCDRWSVVTTIFPPTHLLYQLRNISTWCLVVVGDKKTNHSQWRIFEKNAPSPTIYLSDADQHALPYKLPTALPWNHFGRKNVGYLYAIHQGAQLIWDTDDDNVLHNPSQLFTFANRIKTQQQDTFPVVANTHHLWNPYPHFKPILPVTGRAQDICWPRGFPLSYVKDPATAAIHSPTGETLNRIPSANIGVYQSLADNDPDVDALYRLTRHTPLSFLPAKDNSIYALPPRRVAPFNAQATMWDKSAFWGLLLPVTVHGRVTDIWRSYFTQKLMQPLQLHLAFVSPLAIQFRNVHSLVADLQSEVPLYTQANELTRWLDAWTVKLRFETEEDGEETNQGRKLLATIEQLYVDLYEIGVVEMDDVRLVQKWLEDLLMVGYDFDDVAKRAGKGAWWKSDGGETGLVREAEVKQGVKVGVCVSEWRTSTPGFGAGDGKQRVLMSGKARGSLEGLKSVREELIEEFAEGNADVFVVGRDGKGICESLEGTTRDDKQQKTTGICETVNMPVSVVNATEESGRRSNLRGLAMCERAMSRRAVQTGVDYDWVVSLGTEDSLVGMVDKETLGMAARTPTLFHGNREVCCCANERRFVMGRWAWMREYLRQWWHLGEEGKEGEEDLRWGEEEDVRGLREYLRSRGIELAAHADIGHCS